MEHPTYYAVIPAEVRYNPALSGGAKLLFGEITALCNKRGYCWSSSSYFAELYQVTRQTIQVWLKELESNGHIDIETDANNTRKIYLVNGGVGKILHPPEENLTPPVRKILHPPEEKTPKEGSAGPRKGEEGTLNTTVNTTSNSPADENESQGARTFEEWMEDEGYVRESLVDSDGHSSVWWERDDTRVKARELSELKAKWRKAQGIVPKVDESHLTTENLVATIIRILEREYGQAPVIGNTTKGILRDNLVKKYSKDFIKEYAQWYFVDSDLDKKWRFNIPAFTSERFINSFLSQKQ